MEAIESQSEVLLKRMEDMEDKMDTKIEAIRVEVQSTVEKN